MAEAGPSRPSKHHLTPAEQQAVALERLLAKPDREVHIPASPREKTLRAPREMMKNVSGSSAGAGSGEFHVYKHARRREYERIKLLEEKASKEKSSSSFMIEQAQKAAQDEAKTDKNRAKRDKKKLAKERAKLASAPPGEGADHRQGVVEGGKRKRATATENATASGEKLAAGEKKMRAAPGSEAIAFQRKQQEDSEGSDEE